MTKRKIAWIFVMVFAVTAALGIVLGLDGTHDITLREAQVQEKINANLPLIKNDLAVRRVDIDLQDGTVGISLDAEGKKWGQEFTISAHVEGRPVFDSMDGSFHFQPHAVKVTEIRVKGETVSAKVEKFIDRYVDSAKIDKNKEVIGEEIEKWAHASMEHTTIFALEHLPIYTLPNTLKGNIFRMLLKSVEVHQESLSLHLSFWQLTKMVMLHAVIFTLSVGVAIGLLLNPEWA
ncbi:MAG: hypothetical protein Q7S09_05465 [bacterium]|nr:hypothetical protein [bacterium]